MNRNSGRPQVKLSLLRSISLKIRPQEVLSFQKLDRMLFVNVTNFFYLLIITVTHSNFILEGGLGQDICEQRYVVLLYIYRVAAINPEYFSSYYQMTQHS
jgi:hypothetical protein